MKYTVKSAALALLFMSASLFPGIHAWCITEMVAYVDATQMHRNLLKARTEYAVRPGVVELLYPEWAGIYWPRAPIHNLAEFSVETLDGQSLEWMRDPEDAYIFLVEAPPGVEWIVVRTTYIVNQPTPTSTYVDSHGTSEWGVINWNTCLLYPGGVNISDIDVVVELQLPEGRRWASSLQPVRQEGSFVEFQLTTYEQLVDSPLIFGRYMRTYNLTPPDGPPHYLHVAAEREEDLIAPPETLRKLRSLPLEGMALFGEAPSDAYHFLLVLSDSGKTFGMEHLRSSLNAWSSNGLRDPGQLAGLGELLAHEYAHSWCGKHHRPAGMIRNDFNTPQDTRLLWIYEGLTTYLGVKLAARAGLFSSEDKSALQQTRERLASAVQSQMARTGRRSTNLEDVCVTPHLRWVGSEYWSAIRRDALDYYLEGMFLWMEIDALIRLESDGRRSLDDFCRRFLGRIKLDAESTGYTEEDVIEHLNAVQSYPWPALIDKRVRGYHDSLPLDFLDLLGYRLQYSNQPTEYDSETIRTSLGFDVTDGGVVRQTNPEGPGGRVGVRDGMEIAGVNGWRFSRKRLEVAIAKSVSLPSIDLLAIDGDVFREIVIEYADGPKHFDLVRNSREDLLELICEPLAAR